MSPGGVEGRGPKCRPVDSNGPDGYPRSVPLPQPAQPRLICPGGCGSWKTAAFSHQDDEPQDSPYDGAMAARLKTHSVLDILPPLTSAEIERATERAVLYGQTLPIEVLDGTIVHGLEEYEGCVAAGIAPRLTKVSAPACLVEYVIRRLPRHLSTLDRAVIAVLAEETYKALGRSRMREAGRLGGTLRGKGPRTARDPFGHENWFEVAAHVCGTTPGAVKRLATIRRSAPDVFDAVRTRKLVILRDARDLAHALPTVKARAKVLALRQKHPSLPVADVMRSERAPLPVTASKGESWAVYEGKMENEGRRILDESIDLCIADIVYGHVEMAAEVAKLSKRVLVNGGLLAIIAGHEVLDTMNAVAQHLTPIAVGSYHFRGNTRKTWHGPVQRFDGLPVLFFGKGKARPIAHLVFVSEQREKTWFSWQKNLDATLDLLRSCASPGSRVLDPCCGSATTGEAALRHGCEFVGIDVDPKAVRTSRARLNEVERELTTTRAKPLRLVAGRLH
jgi:DNA methylase